MHVLSCEPATSAVPEWHKELFRGQEDVVSSGEGWAPGSLNLAQAFATKLRALLAHGDITRLLVDFGKSADDPTRFSRFSETLPEDTRQKLDERHHAPYLNLLRQRTAEEQRRGGVALHLSIRTDAYQGMPLIGLHHDPSRDFESSFVARWSAALAAQAPELPVTTVADPNYGLSATLRGLFPENFGSVSLVVDQACFLDGRPIRWDLFKRHLLETLPAPPAAT